MTVENYGIPGLVLPMWGSRRRTRDEWLAAGGDAKIGKPGDLWWPTLGHEIADISTRLKLPPMPHQRYVFDVVGELDPEHSTPPQPVLWYTELDTWVMRQCGKTMGIIFPILVHRLVRMSKKKGYGRQRAAFTMQDRQETRKKLELDLIPTLNDAHESFRRITNPKGRPGRSTREWKSSLNNGSEHLLFGIGNYLLIETPSKTAGHGNTLDAKAADEVRFGTDDRVEASAGPSQITRLSRLLLIASTAGDEHSLYMWAKVLAGLKIITAEDFEARVAAFNWSIPEGKPLDDPQSWIDHHPAVGHTIKVEDILGELRKAQTNPNPEKMETFRQEYANQWIRTPTIGPGDRTFVITPDVWTNRRIPAGFVGPVALAVHVADNGETASVAVAGHVADGRIRVFIEDVQNGVWWIETRLAELVTDRQPVAVAYVATGRANATNTIAGAIARAAGDTPIVRITGTDYASGCQAFVTGINENQYGHSDQEWTNAAIEDAQKIAVGSGWIWGAYSDLADTTPLAAATCAVRALEGHTPDAEPVVEELAGSLMA